VNSSHDANIQTQHKTPEEKNRLSRTHENLWWTSRFAPAPTEKKKTAQRLVFLSSL
jgi:hypothetical protein